MNIEELSKAQLILLTILVNFITSVATVILTVSLLDQAPAVITQTIDRVVERTVETVTESVPAVIKPPAPAPSNQDLVTAALASHAAHTVAIYSLQSGTSTPAISFGTYLPISRVIVTATRESLPKEALIKFAGGEFGTASLARSGSGISIYGFSDTAVLPKAGKYVLVPPGELRLGQTVLAIGSDGAASTGIVSRVGAAGVQTTLPDVGSGIVALDLSGNLVGISIVSAKVGLFADADVITTLLTSNTTATQ